MWEIDLTHFWCLFIALMKLHNEIETNLYRPQGVVLGPLDPKNWVLDVSRYSFAVFRL